MIVWILRSNIRPLMLRKENNNNNNTSWEQVSHWYDEYLEGGGTYQKTLILPNLLRRMNIVEGEHILDLACGQGFFAHAFYEAHANVVGTDLSPELIKIATSRASHGLTFFVSPAHKMFSIKSGSQDKVVIVLALQNIKELSATIAEAARVLKSGGKIFIVLNHPAFRNPGQSNWHYDEKNNVQSRLIESYMSERQIEIDMRPSTLGLRKVKTISFHRPIQSYAKALTNNGFYISRFEEWVSDRKSQKGKKWIVEEKARKEFPLFLFIEAVLYKKMETTRGQV